ncbi:PIG-L deacetylase family protein [Aquihabitans sp. McL0605]|uniref:PIG-L deacetylase family protein n=1 Tax=Aquihabitans sp. McL0605 TaxID=3415671 RepID=UPI003CF52D37
MAEDLEGPIVVVSPHLDDAVLSAWSVLRTEVEVAIAVVFAGVPVPGTTGAFDPIFGTSDSAGLMVARRQEDLAALACAGRTPTHLDLLDVQYRTADLGPDEVQGALEPAVAAGSTLVVPAGIGRHVDHLLVRDAALAIARRRGDRVLLYADQPYATNMGWPSWVTGALPEPHLVPDAAWGRTLAEVAEPSRLVPLVRPLAEAEQAAKLRALRCYRSQIAALEGGPHRRISHPAIAGFELLWTVTEA